MYTRNIYRGRDENVRGNMEESFLSWSIVKIPRVTLSGTGIPSRFGLKRERRDSSQSQSIPSSKQNSFSKRHDCTRRELNVALNSRAARHNQRNSRKFNFSLVHVVPYNDFINSYFVLVFFLYFNSTSGKSPSRLQNEESSGS